MQIDVRSLVCIGEERMRSLERLIVHAVFGPNARPGKIKEGTALDGQSPGRLTGKWTVLIVAKNQRGYGHRCYEEITIV